MIAIGGAIGTGIFLASGYSISTAGPAGALLAYAVIGIMVYFVMTSLGELATYMPVPGAFGVYGTKFVEPSFGFALGWNYWFSWAITIAVELSAGALIMKFWLPDVPGWIWCIVFLALILFINLLSTRAYGEGEFWFASIKVAAVIIIIVVGLCVLIGLFGQSPGFSNWALNVPKPADPASQSAWGNAPFVGGFGSILAIFLIAGFSFQGTEIVGVAAGEGEDPEKNVPKAINSVFWRILLFYIGLIFIIGTIIPFNNPDLLSNDATAIAKSPFVIILQLAHFKWAAHVMNFVVLTSVLSCGSSSIYSSSRLIYSLAKQGSAPKIFGKVSSRGVPFAAILITAAVGLFSFTQMFWPDNVVYTWLLNASGTTGFIIWMGISACHWRFRKSFLAQGHSLKELKYRAKLYPFGPIFALILSAIAILGQNVPAVQTGDWYSVAAAYVSIPVFLGCYIIHKVVTKSKIIPLKNVDLNNKNIPNLSTR